MELRVKKGPDGAKEVGERVSWVSAGAETHQGGKLILRQCGAATEQKEGGEGIVRELGRFGERLALG
jgi:hypothetical protein